ncbi:beta strand repeat-containing protein, partial [Paenibacillus aestuarii]
GTITPYVATPAFTEATNNSVANDAATLGLTGTDVTSSDETIVTAAIGTGADAGKIVITSVAEGTATLTVTDGTNNATIAVTVAADGSISVGTITKYVAPPAFTEATDKSVANEAATLGLTGTGVSSSDETIAKAEIGTGADAGKIVITSVAAGTATLTVTDGTNNATIAVTVAADGSISVGTITPYVATPAFTEATNNSVANDAATLGLSGTGVSSSDETIAKAEIGTGADAGKIVITSVAEGTATLTVTDGTNNATITVTVAADGSISVGTITPYVATPAFTEATNNSVANDAATLGLVGVGTVTSSDLAVAKAEIGTGADAGKIVITSVAEGTATLTVTDGTNNATIAVTVAADGSISVGTITPYVATPAFTEATNNSVANDAATLGLVGVGTVTSSDPAVAKAEIGTGADTGKIVITSVAAGTATLTVTDGTNSATIAVTVAADGSISVGT